MKKYLIVLICLLMCGCNYNTNEVDIENINTFNYDQVSELDFDIHSQEYLIVRVSDLTVLKSKNADKKMYPASLTKIMTLDAILHYADSLDDKSSVTYEQVLDLIDQDASLANIICDHDYSLRDLLYALILPSGADAAVALENYFTNKGMNLIDLMNDELKQLGCNDTNFVNTTGLHDDNHYTTLNDLFKIIWDVLSYEDGRKILETLHYNMEDGTSLVSSATRIYADDAIILGGKTGFTDESGQSINVLYKKNNRSYILLIANAMGNPYNGEFFHYEDAMELIDKLY